MAGSDRVPDPNDERRAQVGKRKSSTRAKWRSSPSPRCRVLRKSLTTADIVRDRDFSRTREVSLRLAWVICDQNKHFGMRSSNKNHRQGNRASQLLSVSPTKQKTRQGAAGLHRYSEVSFYAAFFACALTFAHLARCAAAIFLRAAIDIVRLGAVPLAFPADTSCGPFPTFAHRALWA